MIIGVLSDTHRDEAGALSFIIKEFKRRGVEVIVHCGDIEPKHLKPELFGNIPVFCALIKPQIDRPEFQDPPEGWIFTKPDDRIRDLSKDCRIYLGHQMSFEFLTGSERKLNELLHKIRLNNDGVRWIFGGHTHHQIFTQGHLFSFVNPGAIEDSFDGYEFAIINTETDEIVFCRIPKTKPLKETFSVGIISDSLDISQMDGTFWKKFAVEMKKRGVRQIIHCGNIDIRDVGHSELSDFEVFYNLRKDQKFETEYDNWHQIPLKDPIVEINGYQFYIRLDLGTEFMEQSEYQMHGFCSKLRREYPEIKFVLCGFTNDALFEEGPEIKIINPGDALKDRHFAVVCLPRTEITFGHVPLDPLSQIL
jgi:predicted phosphodiesterase